MATNRPTILFVPGAWHRSTCYAPVIRALQTQGYETATAELASVGANPPLQTWTDDIANIRAVATSLADAGKSIVLVAHSYGALPSGEAVKGLLLRERAALSQPGGVVHIIYISAFLLPAATSLVDGMGGEDLHWFNVSESELEVEPINPAEVFYNDLPAEEQQHHVAQLQSFSYQMVSMKTSWEPYKEVDCSYLYCTKDQAIPLSVQQAMVKGTGVQFNETTVEAGHSPFLSRVEETVRVVVGVAEGV